MPALTCAAITCIYNKDELCSKGRYQGRRREAARQSDDTFCASFVERGTGLRHQQHDGRRLRMFRHRHLLRSLQLSVQ